ncbi:OmpA family protein [Maricaulis sp. CAU 1757]
MTVRPLALLAALALYATPALLPASVQAQTDVEGHPLITPYSGSTGDGEQWPHDAYPLIVGFDLDAREAITETIEGRVTKLYYSHPEGRSELDVFSNYRDALEAAGLEEIWSCAGDGDCSTSTTRNVYDQTNDMRAINGPNSRYVAGRLVHEGSIAYVAVGVGRRATSIHIVETGERPRGQVEINLDALAAGLDAHGHVRVDGLLFAHDSDTLLAESAPSLGVLRDLLEARSELDLYIVGHTDMSGDLAYNLGLSRRRAEAVRTALVEDYGIAPHRLEARGVGPLAPEASNAAEDGRALNRRVEIVAR